jgi:hypothetical protein
MSTGAAPYLNINIKSSVMIARLVIAILMMYTVIVNLDVFKSLESIALLAPGNSKAEPSILDSNIATKLNENDRVGVE